jgi:hypothetical protein
MERNAFVFPSEQKKLFSSSALVHLVPKHIFQKLVVTHKKISKQSWKQKIWMFITIGENKKNWYLHAVQK